ncbi:MAG: CoA-binding protein [bacterium]
MSENRGVLDPADDRVREILSTMKRIAVVGISEKEDRASHGIARFLVGRGLEIVGVNPALAGPVLGAPVFPSLAEVPGHLDVVDVFRRSDAVPGIVDEAIAADVDVIWLQEGVVHEEAAARAVAAGIDVIMDRCLYKEWLRLMNG